MWQSNTPPKSNRFYSQELEDLRAEILEIVRVQVNSLSRYFYCKHEFIMYSQVDQTKKDSNSYRLQVLELRKDVRQILGKVLIEI